MSYQTPHQIIGSGYPQGYAPPPPPPLTAEQKVAMAIHEIREIKSENELAFNQYSLQKVCSRTLNVLEFILSGQITTAHPNQVPGHAPQEDPSKTKVEFFAGPGAGSHVPAGTPVSNETPQMVYAPQGQISVEGGQGLPGQGGQSVEFYGGPPGTPHASPNPGAQRVELFGHPEQPAAYAPAGLPAPVPAHHSVQNPPTAVRVRHHPTRSVEAGNPVSQPVHPDTAAPSGIPVAAPFARPEERPQSVSHPGSSPFAAHPDAAAVPMMPMPQR